MATRTLKTLSVHVQEGKEGIKWDTAIGEETGQSFKTGAPLVNEATTKELLIWAGGSDATTIVGIAAHNASGTAGEAVAYYEANDYNIFEGSLIDNTTAVALAADHINTNYSLVASGNDWYIDVSDTSTTKVRVIEAIDDIGDTNARVKFRFLTDMLTKQGASA